jgi:hypothetical protein
MNNYIVAMALTKNSKILETPLNRRIVESITLLPWTQNSPFIFSNPVISVELGEINYDRLR